MINLTSLKTHRLVNNLIIGLILSDSGKICRENKVIKFRIKGSTLKINYFTHVYNLILTLNPEIIYDLWEEKDDLISFSIIDDELIKFIFYFFYLDERFSVIYTEEGLSKIEEKTKKMVTSWKTVLYNTLKDEPEYQTVKKYVSKRLRNDYLIINPLSIVYWFMDSGYYNWSLNRYCLVVSNFDELTLINVLRILKKIWNLRFFWDQKKDLLILDRHSNEYLELYLNFHIIPDLSWKNINYWSYNKYNEYSIYFIIYLRYLIINENREYRRDLDLN